MSNKTTRSKLTHPGLLTSPRKSMPHPFITSRWVGWLVWAIMQIWSRTMGIGVPIPVRTSIPGKLMKVSHLLFRSCHSTLSSRARKLGRVIHIKMRRQASLTSLACLKPRTPAHATVSPESTLSWTWTPVASTFWLSRSLCASWHAFSRCVLISTSSSTENATQPCISKLCRVMMELGSFALLSL